MEKVKSIIEYLMDPQLVADFQRLCGVVSKEGYGQNGDVHRTKNDNNNLQRNGYAYNLRNRRVPRSPKVQAIEKVEDDNEEMSSSESEEGVTEMEEEEEEGGSQVNNRVHSHERELTHYTYPFYLGLVLAILWCGTVCLSRVYMGMHTLLDLLAGVVFALVILAVMWPLLDIIDEFQVYHPYGPLIMGVVLLLMCVFYPTLDKWSTARGDTTLILGVLAGVAMGSWLNIQQGNYHNEAGAPPYMVKTPDHIWFAKMSCRMVLGLVILFSTRVIMKALTYHLLCHILGYDKKDHMQNKQKLIVELPYKYITYYVIAFNVVYTAPFIFRYLDIEKETYFTEV
ncbi:sphingosine-1-phosphate phosphatase 1 isoform X2 [Lingula anatina]|uniref:Sphingosine-1-phosphate phosphatase 1 isoform X2 n=1 Tax=Lingula anatina TaxID=7574 RepID=A0A1S3ILD5_LINAN|nr:sphingosine-1-phosphate phosphatase 1 isoform X2 [Lingula anatina]|eukprot:XP_013398898.1 sphingosine-1-phosphate phosphatase 1 isoform X2 [Lingula anatina]